MPQTTSSRDVAYPMQSPVKADAGASLSDVFRTLRYRRRLIATCVAVCVLASVIYLLIKKPEYEGSAILRIDPTRASALGLNDLVAGAANVDADAIVHTEVAVLLSDGVALRTLRTLPDAEFQNATGVSKSSAALPAALGELTADQLELLDNFESSSNAKQVEGTALINVTFHAADAKTAAIVANTLVQSYTLQNFASRDGSVDELRTGLSSQIATLKNRVDEAQKKLAAYQEANHVIGTGAGTDLTSNTITDRLKILNQSLATAQADRIEREARLRAAQSAYPSALATLFPNPELTALQAAQGDLTTKAAQMSAKFGPKYPPLVEMNKQLATIDWEITNNANTVRHRLQEEFDASKKTQDMLQGQYDAQTQAAFGVNRNQAQLAVLQGDVTTSRELYDILQRKMQQASVDADINGLNTVLVDSSRVPRKPVAPKKLLILAGSVILGLFAGIVAAFAGEAASDALRNPAQLEREIGLPVLGMVPRRDGGKGVPGLRSLATLDSPASKGAEAYRKLRSALLFSLPGEQAKKLLITSALPGEGASEVAANLAVSLAQAGYRVLAVDTDLRFPSLHTEFGIENTSGLSNALSNTTTATSGFQQVKGVSGLFVLTAGPRVALPEDRFSSEAFRSELQQWDSSFDYVLLLSSPLLLVSDGYSVAGQADAAVLVTRWGASKLKTLAQVRGVLDRVNSRVAGAVINQVPQTEMEDEAHRKVADAYFA